MARFKGFPPGKVRFSRIPAPFYTELLPQIDDLHELKTTLYALWQLDQMEGERRYLQASDFETDAIFMQALAKNFDQSKILLTEALSKIVNRGTFLLATLELEGQDRHFYFLNSARGRHALEEIEKGNWRPSGDQNFPIELMQEKPNVYSLYESNIGPLTPMIADSLKDAENEFPHDWIEEAFRTAVENNVRKWSYVQAILVRWQEEGRDEGRHQRDTEKDRRKYVEGRLSDFIKH